MSTPTTAVGAFRRLLAEVKGLERAHGIGTAALARAMGEWLDEGRSRAEHASPAVDDDDPEHDCSDDPCDRHNPYVGEGGDGGRDDALNQSLRDSGRGHLIRE